MLEHVQFQTVQAKVQHHVPTIYSCKTVKDGNPPLIGGAVDITQPRKGVHNSLKYYLEPGMQIFG
jgi:hypothetical protein